MIYLLFSPLQEELFSYRHHRLSLQRPKSLKEEYFRFVFGSMYLCNTAYCYVCFMTLQEVGNGVLKPGSLLRGTDRIQSELITQ